MRSTVFLICGLTGAGKTAFARSLETQRRAVRFSIDEWMVALFGLHPGDEFDDKETRCQAIIRDVVGRLIARGVNVVLDFGFFTREARDHWREFAEEIGAKHKTYFVTCSEATLRRRLAERNADLPDGTFEITEEMLDRFIAAFEPPDEDEAVVIDTEVDPPG